MSNVQNVTVDFEDPETVSVSSNIEDESYMGPLIDALNDGLITEPGTYEVEVTNNNGRYTFEIPSR